MANLKIFALTFTAIAAFSAYGTRVITTTIKEDNSWPFDPVDGLQDNGWVIPPFDSLQDNTWLNPPMDGLQGNGWVIPPFDGLQGNGWVIPPFDSLQVPIEQFNQCVKHLTQGIDFDIEQINKCCSQLKKVSRLSQCDVIQQVFDEARRRQGGVLEQISRLGHYPTHATYKSPAAHP